MPIRAQIVTWIVAALAALALRALPIDTATAGKTDDGIVHVKSGYGVDETVDRLHADIEKKGITFFLVVDQAQLGAEAGHRSSSRRSF